MQPTISKIDKMLIIQEICYIVHDTSNILAFILKSCEFMAVLKILFSF